MEQDSTSATASLPRPDLTGSGRFVDRLPKFLRAPDPHLLEASAGGERLVAWTRLYFWGFISLAPLSAMLVRGVETPIDVPVHRREVYEAIRQSEQVAED